MALRAISSATVSFGLVSIPIKVYSPKNASSGISFRTLHEKCGTPLKQQMVCPQDGEVVDREDRIKGYEFAKGQFVTFNEDEIKAVEAVGTKTIAITEFVPLDQVDPVFFDKPYYLGPDKGGARAYALLSKALKKAGLCGLAKYASRGKQYLVMLRPIGDGGLVMQQLLYADEIRSFDEVPVEEPAEIKKAELDLALQLIQQTASKDFEPAKYSDEVKAALNEIIERKVQGQEVTIAPTEEPKAQVIDLMDALKQSLGQGVPKKKAAKKSAKTTRKTPTKKKKAAKG